MLNAFANYAMQGTDCNSFSDECTTVNQLSKQILAQQNTHSNILLDREKLHKIAYLKYVDIAAASGLLFMK